MISIVEKTRVEQTRVEQTRVEQTRVKQTRVEQTQVEQTQVEHPIGCRFLETQKCVATPRLRNPYLLHTLV